VRFQETPISGAFVIELEKREDDRGFFARAFCENEFRAHGLSPRIVQMNNSVSRRKGTVRGMHYQLTPKAETKVVRCMRGALFDIVLDLRKDSPTFGKSFGTELSEDNHKAMYVPKGFAHGFITLRDNTEALYLVDEFYAPTHERCIRWNDARFNIQWPAPMTVISDKDRDQKDFDPVWHLESPA
jgi:dTDP-4-dehydrorhamnose 3,5-epimerase